MGNYLSHSQTETWTQCRKRWFLQKVEGAPQAPSEALILGTAVHAAIEADGRRIMTGETPANIDVLWCDFVGALDEALRNDDPAGLIVDESYADMKDKGDAMLQAYVRHLQPRYSPLAVEDSFTVDLHGAPGWRFTGRIDARACMSDGSLCLIDFKTASKPWERGIEHAKPQASAYLMADSERPPLAQAQAVVFVVFPVAPDGNGGYTCVPQFRVTTRTNAQIDAYARSLVTITEQITAARRSGDFPASTGPLCGGCGVRGSCAEGRAYMARTGRKAWTPEVSAKREAGTDA